MLVRQAYLDWLPEAARETTAEWARTHHLNPPKLFMSDLGRCPRLAFHDATAHLPHHPFYVGEGALPNNYLAVVLREGLVAEAETAKALKWLYGRDLYCQMTVSDNVWIGHPDFYIGPTRTQDAIVIEHKATKEENFTTPGRLPCEQHCLQVLAYRKFLLRVPGPRADVQARLYYRTFGHWAEFIVYDEGSHIEWKGWIDDLQRKGRFGVSLADTMQVLETYWLAGELPSRYPHPLNGCAKTTKSGAVYPQCKYWAACWPEYPSEGPFNL